MPKTTTAKSPENSAKPAAKGAKTTPMCLVQLQDHKNTWLMLVRPEVMAWIQLPYSPPAGAGFGYVEEVPENIREEYFEAHQCTTRRVTCGSYDNDRAMSTMSMGQSFDSLKSMMAYVKRHNIDIVDEYHGHRY